MLPENMCIKKCNKSNQIRFVQHFQCSGKNEIQMHVLVMKYKLYNFGNSPYELNAIIFAFKIVIAQNEDNW